LACNVFGDGHTACDVQSAVSRPQGRRRKTEKAGSYRTRCLAAHLRRPGI